MERNKNEINISYIASIISYSNKLSESARFIFFFSNNLGARFTEMGFIFTFSDIKRDDASYNGKKA